MRLYFLKAHECLNEGGGVLIGLDRCYRSQWQFSFFFVLVNQLVLFATTEVAEAIPNCWICHEVNHRPDSIVAQLPK